MSADIHRERDLREFGIGAEVQNVDGRPDLVSIVVTTEGFDRLCDSLHPEYEGYPSEDDLDHAEETGREQGYAEALSDIRALAADKTSEAAS